MKETTKKRFLFLSIALVCLFASSAAAFATDDSLIEPEPSYNYCEEFGHEYDYTIIPATSEDDGIMCFGCVNCSEIVEEYNIAIPKIALINLSTSECTYNGKERTPSVAVKDADGNALLEGQDYDIIYPGTMKLPGKYDIIVNFKGNYEGKKILPFVIAPKSTTGVKAKSQTTSSITLTWSKTTGATGYRVYQYSSSKGEYVLKKSVKGTTTYKVTGLKAGTTYKFKIKPYVKSDDGTVIWGSASSALSTGTKPSTPTVKSVTASSSKATLSWNNVSGESGYQVYYSTSKSGTYKKMESVSSNTVKYTTSKLTAGKTYYFKIRAYKKVDGKVFYGEFSAVKSVAIPKASTSSGTSGSASSKPTVPQSSVTGTYYVTETGSKYHLGSCRSLRKSKIPVSYDYAKRFYDPCGICIY